MNLFDYSNQFIKQEKKNISNNNKVLSVTEFNNYVNSIISIQQVIVEGEISGFKIAKERLIYFDLKDDKSVVSCFLFKFQLDKMGVVLEDGMKIQVTGTPNLHSTGRFNLIAEFIKPVGEGSIKRALELLKQKLFQEGIFAPERKRPLPKFPENIGLITSQDAAAYTDFIKVLSHRFGGITIYFYPVSVQGEKAPNEITEAFNYFNQKMPNLNVLVLTRGGGSLEDLMAFNSEKVVRSVFGSKIPVICAVGHERDESLSDFAADKRASTPSNAAELLVPERSEVEWQLNKIKERFVYQMDKKIKSLEQFYQILENRMNIWWQNLLQKLELEERLLKSFDPEAILERGYSITMLGEKILKNATQVKMGDKIITKLKKGKVESTVN
ncbi:MAG: exodeoxyribonuclease VII large subunit [Patescibacteria group bacterium]